MEFEFGVRILDQMRILVRNWGVSWGGKDRAVFVSDIFEKTRLQLVVVP
jgi:hypothetical protein